MMSVKPSPMLPLLISQAVALHQKGRFAEAERLYLRILKDKPDNFDAQHMLGFLRYHQRRYTEALHLIGSALEINPNEAGALSNYGLVLMALKRSEDALASYDKALAINPVFAEALSNRGNALQELKRYEDALASYDEALAIKPALAEALYNRGNILRELKRYEHALASYDKALAIKLDYAEAANNRGNTLQELKRYEDALASYDKALATKPDYAEALSNRGITLHKLKRYEDALASHAKALAIKPALPEALYNSGNTLHELKRYEDALASYDKALAINPALAEALYNRGNTLHELKRHEDALATYDKALAIKPAVAEALYNRGNILRELKRYEEALASYDKAIALEPDYAAAHRDRGNALLDLNRPAEALASYDSAMILKPDLAEVEGVRLHTKMLLCDWSNFDKECTHLISAVRNGNMNTPPFVFLATPSSSDDQLRCAKLYAAITYLPSGRPVWRGERYNNNQIRVAYLSADFRSHPLAYLTAGLFEQHDHSRFEIIGVSFGVDDRSEIRKRLVAAFDEFHDVTRRSDEEVAKLLRDLQVDIAIDLMGYTRNSRPGIFAFSPAPIQVNYLGYPSTMGAQFIHYIIADEVVAPFEHQQSYAERLVHLPNCYLANNSRRKIAERTPTRQEMGLPENAFMFCCFNNNWKITPTIFDIWMRLLHQVEGSMLWLFADNECAERNLRQEAQRRGINSSRLVFGQRLSLDEHLVRHRVADLFLDTLPYNAHTTASDALWTGLPVLTCLGETFAGRVAASLLNAIHLPELITPTLEAYEALAIELATNPEKLARVKRRLAYNRLTTPLFDTKRFAQHIEAAYTAMYERYLAGLPPANIYVPNS